MAPFGGQLEVHFVADSPVIVCIPPSNTWERSAKIQPDPDLFA
jgi:hypothetical protein